MNSNEKYQEMLDDECSYSIGVHENVNKGNSNQKKKIVIELTDWDYTCADRCCDTYGVSIKVNGNDIEGDATEPQAALRSVLGHLGYDVEFI